MAYPLILTIEMYGKSILIVSTKGDEITIRVLSVTLSISMYFNGDTTEPVSAVGSLVSRDFFELFFG